MTPQGRGAGLVLREEIVTCSEMGGLEYITSEEGEERGSLGCDQEESLLGSMSKFLLKLVHFCKMVSALSWRRGMAGPWG